VSADERSIAFGAATIHYAVTPAARKTLGITVRPDLTVEVRAPVGATPDEVETVVRKRAAWILRQQRELSRYLPHLPPRQYVSGESHRYLGRQFRLKVLAGPAEASGVTQTRSSLEVAVDKPGDPARVRELLDAWYLAQAERVFSERLAACYPKVQHLGLPYPRLVVRELRTRWGNCDADERITLNIKLILVPEELIDYVLYHELCHLKELHHGKSFYQLLGRVLPDWRERKRRLEEFDFG
jgi:predicted metal-dependent hydrolase